MDQDSQRPWQKNWREGSPTTPEIPPSNNTAPSRGDPFGSSFSSRIARDNASNNFTKSRLPKHFDQPLTCFYWHRYGHCKKAEDECLYAHYETGVVAAAPFSLESGEHAVAGRNATKQLNNFTKEQTDLEEKDRWLTAGGMRLDSKAGKAQAVQAMEELVGGVYQVIADAKAVLHDASVTLNRAKVLIAVDDEDGRDKASAVMRNTLVNVAHIVDRLNALEEQAESHLGGPVLMLQSNSMEEEA